MRSLARRYQDIEKKHPDWSTIICFNTTVWGQRYSEPTIRRWFYRLVDKDDYDAGMIKEILAFAFDLTGREDDIKSTSFDSQANAEAKDDVDDLRGLKQP